MSVSAPAVTLSQKGRNVHHNSCDLQNLPFARTWLRGNDPPENPVRGWVGPVGVERTVRAYDRSGPVALSEKFSPTLGYPMKD